MARIELAPEVINDLKRFLDHMDSYASPAPQRRIADLIDALDILTHSPLIGRPVGHSLRELIIGRRPNIYLALYRYIERIDTAFILALRHQAEIAYKRDKPREPGG